MDALHVELEIGERARRHVALDDGQPFVEPGVSVRGRNGADRAHITAGQRVIAIELLIVKQRRDRLTPGAAVGKRPQLERGCASAMRARSIFAS